MQVAKKLVLVDEFDRKYERLQRPAAAVAKADHSLRLSDSLRDGTLSDDRKVRKYVGALHRYRNVGDRTWDETPAKINWATEPTKSRKKTTKKPAARRTRQWDQY